MDGEVEDPARPMEGEAEQALEAEQPEEPEAEDWPGPIEAIEEQPFSYG